MKKIQKKIESFINKKCYYIGKIGDSFRIVYYDGEIIEDLGDNVKCKMIDRNINESNNYFEIIFSKNKIKIKK